jgi:hypothetical protein
VILLLFLGSVHVDEGKPKMPLLIERRLLTKTWTADVDAIEGLLKGRALPSPEENRKVIFFEVAGDGMLHVTVLRERESFTTTPWSGPEQATDGFRYVHAFGDRPVRDIATSIREQLSTSTSKG